MSDHTDDKMTLDDLLEILEAKKDKYLASNQATIVKNWGDGIGQAVEIIEANREALEAGIKRSAILELAESLLKMAEPEGTIETITEVPNDYYKPQTATTGVNAYFATWPGDETEEELLALLEEL